MDRDRGRDGRGRHEAPRRWLSALAVQVLLFNLLALVFFIFGVYWVQTARVSLVEERVKSIMAPGAKSCAAALARYAS